MAFDIPDLPVSATAEQTSQSQVDADDFLMLATGAGRTAVLTSSSGQCAVTSNSNQTVAVAAGQVRIGGQRATVATQTVSIAANASGNPRFDLITVGLTGTAVATQGAASPAPVFPAIPANSIVLAAVWVASPLQASIVAGDIRDRRMLCPDDGIENVEAYGAFGDAIAGTTGGVPNASSTFTDLNANFVASDVGKVIYIQGGGIVHTVTGATNVGTAVTVTLGSTSDLRIGQFITIASIAGFTTNNPNGTFVITGLTLTTVSYTVVNAPTGAYSSGGTVTQLALITTIAGRTSSTVVTLAATAGSLVTAGAGVYVYGHDDNAAITSALAQLGPASALYFPAGNYMFSSAVLYVTPTINLLNLTDVEIYGNKATLTNLTESTDVVRLNTCTRCTVHDLRLQTWACTNARNSTGRGIYMVGSTDINIVGNVIGLVGSAGIMNDGTARSTVSQNTVQGTLADGITTINAASNVAINGNRLLQTGDDSISIVGYQTASAQAQRISVVNNDIYQSSARGVTVLGARNVTVDGNDIDFTHAAGVFVGQDTTAPNTYGSQDISIVGNTITNARTYSTPTADHGAIHVYSGTPQYAVDGVTISSNTVRTPGRYFFFCDGAAPQTTTVAAGSNGVNTNTFAGAGTLNVASTTSFPSPAGVLTCATGTTTANISYTGTTSTTFTGCTTLGTSGGVLATSGVVTSSPATANINVVENAFYGPPTDTVAGVQIGTTSNSAVVNCRLAANWIAKAQTSGVTTWGVNAVIENNHIYYPNQGNAASITGILHSGGTGVVRGNVVYADPAKNTNNLDSTSSPQPTAAAVAGASNAGTSPPAPVINRFFNSGNSGDTCGSLTFGTGTTATGTGSYVTVTFVNPWPNVPHVIICPTNAATAIKSPYVLNVTATTFDVGLGVAGAVSQGNTVYGVAWTVDP